MFIYLSNKDGEISHHAVHTEVLTVRHLASMASGVAHGEDKGEATQHYVHHYHTQILRYKSVIYKQETTEKERKKESESEEG